MNWPDIITLTLSSPTFHASFHHSADSLEETIIDIGRRPSNTIEWTAYPNQALFRCAVVSRKHAKIIMASDGVFIEDTFSHHGTFLTHPGDNTQQIQPGARILLSDADILAFGKTVGKDDEQVSPIVVSVSLERHDDAMRRSGRYGISCSSPSHSSQSSLSSPSEDVPYEDQVEIKDSPPCLLSPIPIPSFAPFREYLFKSQMDEAYLPHEAAASEVDEDEDEDEQASSMDFSDSSSVEITNEPVELADVPAVETVSPVVIEQGPVEPPIVVEDETLRMDRDEPMSSYVVYPPQYDVEELKASISTLEDRVTTLNDRRKSYRSRFNTNMYNVSRKFNSVNQRLADTSSSVASLEVRVNDLSEDRTRLDAVVSRVDQLEQEQADKMDSDRAAASNKAFFESEFLRARMQQQAQPEEEEESVVEEPVVQKRKRVEDDEPTLDARANKKMRRAGETATAFVLGAVAAWSALAFY